MAAQGAEEGLWLRAERQTGGRGRMGRSWTSEPGNLHASTLIRLRPGDPPAPTLALVCAVAAQETAQAMLPAGLVTIKWPNDLMVGNAKLCGMLLERQGDAVIAGFGLNVAHAPELPGRAATSLAACGAAPEIDAAAVATDLAARFAHWLDIWRREGVERIRTAWLRAAHQPGTPLRVVQPDGSELHGAFDGLTADGGLILALEDGARHVIHAGDVFAI
jgi:BirA family biotin operon repressor/biotin-[acetyl-CoA-carboxylase] ligase